MVFSSLSDDPQDLWTLVERHRCSSTLLSIGRIVVFGLHAALD